MGIQTNEGYLGHDEIEAESHTYEGVRMLRVEGRNNIIYRDEKTGRFISEKGLVRKTE